MKPAITCLMLLLLAGCGRPRWAYLRSAQGTIGAECSGPNFHSREEYIREGVPAAAASDEFYYTQFHTGLTCAEIHKSTDDGDLKGFWVVHIVGTDKDALFSLDSDAFAWVEEQEFVKLPGQVR